MAVTGRRGSVAAAAAAAGIVLALAAVAAPSSCSLAHSEAARPGSTTAALAEAISVVDPARAEDPAKAIDASSFWLLAGAPEEDAIDALMDRMDPAARLGQLFMLSYGGDEPTPLLYSWIRGRGLGGVKIFGWNADDTTRLATAIRSIQKAAESGPLDIPPFVATDQEGGWIRHVRGSTSVTPGNMAIGASAWPSDAYRSAYYIGLELSALGITMNFAPSVDLATRPDSTIIGPRAFSYDPVETGILAAAWARGMADAGVVATAKHYPGHGDTELDSHGILPVIDIDETTLWNRELVPYRMLAAEGIPGVMSGHLAFPKIVGSMEPASLSKHIIQDLLRDRMGYDGLVITDDLMMTGAASSGGLSETCELAIRAGNDILMFSRTLALDDAAWNRLASLYRSDPSFKARVDESVRRILRAKLRWLLPLGRDGIIPDRDPAAAMRSAESQEFFEEQAMRSATVFGIPGLPLPDEGRTLVAGPFGDFIAEAQARIPGAETFRFSYQPAEKADASELAAFRSRLSRADTVVVCIANPAGAAFATAARESGKRLYIVSALNPSYALGFSDCATVVAVYSYARESFKAAFAVLEGDVQAMGRLPIEAGS
ncbi:MAG: glycosyl hydrolase family 3 [Spirochaetae bacterium HGW-Spirochaetae-3]|jgi:beta-N-acetylhexosaminidase|nr:MAG: glycosyl hydrolase family 3 [Spirochaetae bacterium HGW-Spirochaetae-3]